MSVLPTSAHQRHARRFRVDEQVRVRVLGSEESTHDGRILDFSETGLGLHVSAAVPVFAEVLIEYRGLFMPGSVAYCLPNANGFKVGLQLEPLPAIHSGLLELSDHVVQTPITYPDPKLNS